MTIGKNYFFHILAIISLVHVSTYALFWVRWIIVCMLIAVNCSCSRVIKVECFDWNRSGTYVFLEILCLHLLCSAFAALFFAYSVY